MARPNTHKQNVVIVKQKKICYAENRKTTVLQGG